MTDRTAPAGAATVAPVPVRLTVLSGPSAVGKGTVVRVLRHACPRIWISVSATTRRPRPGERHGREYFFVTENQFREMADSGGLLEWARYTGNYYGTPREPVEARLSAGTPVLLEVDVAGARQVRSAVPDALLVFLAPPSWAELERRLIGRGTEAAEVRARRLAVARDELAAEGEFDITLVNHSVNEVCDQLVALMLAQPACGPVSLGGARRHPCPCATPVIGKADRGRYGA